MLVSLMTTGACQLRSVTEADVSLRYLGWLQDERINQYLETRWTEQNLDSIRAYVRSQIAAVDSALLAIEFDGIHIGNLKIGPINEHHKCADISYFIGDQAYWGRGLATAAIRRAVAYGFEDLNLHRMQAGVYAGNIASIRALEKSGFLREGLWRQQLSGPNGWEDHLFFGILRHEWPPSKPALLQI